MTEIPYNIEDAVLHIITGTARLPVRNIEMRHRIALVLRGDEFDLLVYGGQELVVSRQAHCIQTGLLLE